MADEDANSGCDYNLFAWSSEGHRSHTRCGRGVVPKGIDANTEVSHIHRGRARK